MWLLRCFRGYGENANKDHCLVCADTWSRHAQSCGINKKTTPSLFLSRGFPCGSDSKESAMQETWLQSLGGEDPLEKGMAAHSSILAWRMPWTEERGRQQVMGTQEAFMTEWPTHILLSMFLKSLIEKASIQCCGIFNASLSIHLPHDRDWDLDPNMRVRDLLGKGI